MEESQVVRMFDKEPNGNERPLGGAIVRLPVATAVGQLNELEVSPAEVEQIQEDFWGDQLVCLKLADRRVWLDEQEVTTLITLLEISLTAARQNLEKVV